MQSIICSIFIHIFIMSPASSYHISTFAYYCYHFFSILLPLFFPPLFDIFIQGSRYALKLNIIKAQLLSLQLNQGLVWQPRWPLSCQSDSAVARVQGQLIVVVGNGKSRKQRLVRYFSESGSSALLLSFFLFTHLVGIQFW